MARVATYRDELLAYLNFDYLRARHAAPGVEFLLTYNQDDGSPIYHVLMRLPDDLLASSALLMALEHRGIIDDFELRYQAEAVLERQRSETRTFVAAYRVPVRKSLEQLPSSDLRAGTRAFVMFKSMTDPRTRRSAEPRLRRLGFDEAGRIAVDIIAVAGFFGLPLDSFLGIGAMENNFMNVAGDLEHTVWKRRAEPGDTVVRRSRGRVLVRNNAIGRWQITRETLRYAHSLYLKDTRDYSVLPERLRPARVLDIDGVDPEVLTTYAGLLFRSLLDRFHGNVGMAVGAYNGGPANPVAVYEQGVGAVAGYARDVLEHSARLHSVPVASMRFISAGRPVSN